MPLPPLLPAFPVLPVSVTVVFRGLLTFCFDGTRYEVGVLNDDATGPGHDLLFRKWIKPVGGPCTTPTPYDTPATSFELRVNKAEPSVDRIYIIGNSTFSRTTPAGNHPNDFRWMIDFDLELHPSISPVPKIPARVSPRLTINKGVFYTHHKTNTKFNAHHAQGTPVKPLDSVAEVMAARIYLAVGGSVDVVIDGAVKDTLPQTTGIEYQIDVFNLCDPSPNPQCRYVSGHPTDRTRRNDFFMYYNALSIGAGDQFHLMAVHPTADSEITGICRVDGEHGTDPAPCGGGGFGGSGGFGGP